MLICPTFGDGGCGRAPGGGAHGGGGGWLHAPARPGHPRPGAQHRVHLNTQIIVINSLILYPELCCLKKYLELTNMGLFLVNDMHTSPLHLVKSRFNFLVENDTQCSETNEKSISRFL